MAQSKDDLLGSLKANQAGIDKIDEKRDQLMRARRLALSELHRDHGMSLRSLGEICRMTPQAVKGNIEALDAQLAEERRADAEKCRPVANG